MATARAKMYAILFVIYIVYSVQCEVVKKPSLEDIITKQMMGVDTVHDVKIDKNTIITRNLKLDNKKNRNSAQSKMDEEKPDWSYNSIPDEISTYVTDFKRNMSECLKEVQANDKRPVKMLSPKKDSPINGECLIACVLKRNAVIHNRKVSKANLITLVSKFYAKDSKVMKKLEKNLDRCIEYSSRARDDCDMALRLNDCTNDLMSGNKHKITVNFK